MSNQNISMLILNHCQKQTP